MGLDIHIGTDKNKEIYTADYYAEENDYFNKHGLSRTFCDFMCRRHAASSEPELDQIGRLSGVDISALYIMEQYCSESSANEQFSFIDSEKEREQFLNNVREGNKQVEGNIDMVCSTINSLIDSLSKMKDLHQKLDPGEWGSLDYNYYFTDFNTDKGKGYIGNNFGQDLRNFKRFLEFAKSKGATTVWFDYG